MMKKIIFALMITVMLLAPVVLAKNEKQTEPLDKITFIHYKDGEVKQVGGVFNSPTCYKLMGIKWNSLPVSYVINPTNPQKLDSRFICSAVTTSAETWDAATSKELFKDYVGSDKCPINLAATYGVQDYQNAITFGNYPTANVIAVTSVWYTRYGKQIVEFDQLYNTRFTWGDATINPAVMDLQNIATHELGHSVGLDDIYSKSCTAVTMFGYSNNGEIIKRTLEPADVTGLRSIYGS
jgi:hypothetical protein